jgi:hypothetical protein
MNAMAYNTVDWYMRMLAHQIKEVKLDLISKLSASMIENDNIPKNDMSFFDGLTNAWDDGISPEEEMRIIRESRTHRRTRKIEDL